MYRVIVGAAGFVFALVGFALSLLSVLFTLLFSPLQANPTTGTPQRRRTRALHVSVREDAQTSITSPAPTPGTSDVRRTTSSSTPATCGSMKSSSSPPSLSFSGTGSTPPSYLRRRPTINFVHQGPFPTPSSRKVSSVPSERVFVPIVSQDGRYGLKVSTMWADKPPKLYHYVSSPHLMTPPPSQSQRIEQQPKRKQKMFCKGSSSDRSKPRSLSLDTRVVSRRKFLGEKISRTNPYAAPYFVPPPVPQISDPANNLN